MLDELGKWTGPRHSLQGVDEASRRRDPPAGGPMKHARGILTSACLAAAMTLTAATQTDAQANQTATQFYMAYRAAFQKATKVEDILPFMSKARRAEIEKTPAGERAKMFEFIKEFDTYTQIKVVKEEKSATGATLSVEGVDGDKKKSTATVDVTREDGAWKLGKESWSTKG